VLLIFGREATLSPDEMETVLSQHRALQAETRDDDLVAVAKLDVDARRFDCVTGKTARHEVMDGPHAETKEWLVGFYLLECKSEEEALERAKQLCVVDRHRIEVRRVEWSWP